MDTKLRGVGRTRNMVHSLPRERCIVVSSNYEISRYIKNMIEDIRGNDISKLVKVIVIADIDDCQKLYGYSNLIFFDHSFYESSIPREVIEKALDLAHSSFITYQNRKN